MADIAAWLTERGLAKHIETFRANDIDFDVLSSLGEDEFKELGLSLGDRKRLFQAIADISQAPSEAARPATSAAHAPERRQLTVVFIDLVGSTALSGILDPEDLRDVMRGYHQAVAEAIRETGGFVAKFMGDGVLAYFGYPLASEDAAERAVRAGLRAVADVKALTSPRNIVLGTRVGIATGPVVVGDVTGEDVAREVNVVGETPNLAARLLSVGRPDSVIVAGSTRRLIGDLFVLQALEPQSLKGVAEPVLAFQALSERQGLSRFEATRLSHRSSFVGRGQEVGLLLDRWEQAQGGDGQAVVLSGEAGIGKSRITEALWQSVAKDAHYRFRYQCTPQHTNSPLYPAITELAARVDFQPEDGDAARLERVRAAMPDVAGDQVALIAELLGVPLPKDSGVVGLAPARHRTLLLDGFADEIVAHCRRHPVLWVIEDAHWIDPTTEELISRVVDRAANQRLLILITQRPEYKAPWISSPIATQLPLSRLSRGHTNALLEGLAGNRTIPVEVLDHVSGRADGVPLFMEELFHALRDSGALRETATAYELARPLDSLEIPSTLQDSLMARLDRLTPAKAVAQLGAAIGREFDHSLLSRIAGMHPEVLTEGLGQLLAAGLLFSRGVVPDLTYAFKHALIQDAAHGSMLRERRQDVHRRIALALCEREEQRPELVAQHFEAAGQSLEAAQWLDRAGDLAVKGAANQEAIRSWSKALQLMSAVQASSERTRWSAEANLKLTAALVQVEGYGSHSASQLGEEALRQAQELGDMTLYARICTSFAPSLFAQQDFARVERQLSQIPEEALTNDESLRTGYLCMRGVVHDHLGRCREALRDLSTIADYTNDVTAHDIHFGGGDVRVVARSYLGRARVMSGLLDQALSVVMEALKLAREIGHPFSIGWALQACGRVNMYQGKYAAAVAFLDESMDVCFRYGYIARHAHSQTLKGITLLAAGEIDAGVSEFRKGRESWGKSSGVFSTDYQLMEASHHLAVARQFDLVGPILKSAGEYYAEYPERVAFAEYARVRGVLAVAGGDLDDGKSKFEEAIDISREQGALLYELRASCDLARLLQHAGDNEGATRVLKPVYDRFTEGFAAPDLIAAKALLTNLNRQVA
jgi:class 3 adenylate cyclase/tetratricopeptide (TPR) repeat protein